MDRHDSGRKLDRIAEYVVGKESRAWARWFQWASTGEQAVITYTALAAVLLSLGPPPAPEHLTQNLTDIALESLPEAHRVGRKVAKRARNELERRWRKQIEYNPRVTDFCKEHGLVRYHQSWDPAQFRKLYAAYIHMHVNGMQP